MDETGPDRPEPEPRPPLLHGWGGCLLWAVAAVFVVLGGCAVGLVLRPDPQADQRPTTAATGDGWTLKVRVDEQDDPCAELYADESLVTAQCGYVVDREDGAADFRATSARIDDDTVVIFAPVPSDVASVRLRLADGSRPVVPVQDESGISYFAYQGPEDDQGPTELLDADGEPVKPPD